MAKCRGRRPSIQRCAQSILRKQRRDEYTAPLLSYCASRSYGILKPLLFVAAFGPHGLGGVLHVRAIGGGVAVFRRFLFRFLFRFSAATHHQTTTNKQTRLAFAPLQPLLQPHSFVRPHTHIPQLRSNCPKGRLRGARGSASKGDSPPDSPTIIMCPFAANPVVASAPTLRLQTELPTPRCLRPSCGGASDSAALITLYYKLRSLSFAFSRRTLNISLPIVRQNKGGGLQTNLPTAARLRPSL